MHIHIKHRQGSSKSFADEDSSSSKLCSNTHVTQQQRNRWNYISGLFQNFIIPGECSPGMKSKKLFIHRDYSPGMFPRREWNQNTVHSRGTFPGNVPAPGMKIPFIHREHSQWISKAKFRLRFELWILP